MLKTFFRVISISLFISFTGCNTKDNSEIKKDNIIAPDSSKVQIKSPKKRTYYKKHLRGMNNNDPTIHPLKMPDVH